MRTDLTRRDLVRLLGTSAAALWLPRSGSAWAKPAPLPTTPAVPDERFWASVREQFVMPPDLAVMNAANLCPSSAPVLEALYKATREMDREPSPGYREQMTDAKEVTRRALAEFLRVTPGGDRHHPQHQRVQQPRLQRPRSESRRRGPPLLGQPSEQRRRVEGEGAAPRVSSQRRGRGEPAPGSGVLPRGVHQGA